MIADFVHLDSQDLKANVEKEVIKWFYLQIASFKIKLNRNIELA